MKRRKKKTEGWEGGGREKGREGHLEGRKEREKRKGKDQKRNNNNIHAYKSGKGKVTQHNAIHQKFSTAHINVTISTTQ